MIPKINRIKQEW